MKKIYLAGGCFWGVQRYFDQVIGVKKTSVGYVNSDVANPSYELVCSGRTNASEAIELVYDDKQVSLEEILNRFFSIIDPTLLNRQGNDIGTQYRSGIYTQELKSLEYIKAFIHRMQACYQRPIQTEIGKLINYYLAEEYHQKYLVKNPQGYCHIDLSTIP